jgi:response regulator of citrate/malate metabolism
MTTALNDKKTVEQSYKLGCDGYAWKPIDLDKFEEVLIKLNLTDGA